MIAMYFFSFYFNVGNVSSIMPVEPAIKSNALVGYC